MLACWAIAAMPAVATGSEEPVVRESEFELPAAEAWQQEGFRVQLRFGTESLTGLDSTSPAGGGWAIGVEPGVRLSRYWSLSASLRYSVLNEEVQGLRWSTTADLTFHPYGGLFLAVGAGYGGLLTTHWESGGCQGHAIVGLGRLGWLFSVGEIFSTGPMLQVDAQATRCGNRDEEDGGFGDEDMPSGGFRSNESSRRSLWWYQRTVNFSWSVAWR